MDSELPLNKYIAISPFYGLALRPGTQFLSLGDYKLCNKNYLESNFPNSKGTFKSKIQVHQNQIPAIDFYFIIREKIIASNIEEANKIFVLEIGHLVNTLLYCISFRSSENQKISIRKENISQAIYIQGESQSQKSSLIDDLINPIYFLDEEVFSHKGNNIKIFQYLSTEPKSNIEKRIKSAVSWIGQALINSDITEGFLELAIALETLLIFQDGFISKSITAQLAEFAAFLTETELLKRIEVQKKVKDLYRKRSAIVHSFSTNIEEKDFQSLLEILKIIIHKYFILIETEKIKEINDINSHIERLRFS